MSDPLRHGRELFTLGARLGTLGTLAVGSGGGGLARALARTAGCGAALAGAEVRFHDGSCAACGAWLAGYYGFPASLFLRQEGESVLLYLHDGAGRSLSPADLPAALPAASPGEWDLLAGADCAWAARRAGEASPQRGLVWADGPAALTFALERLGFEVADRPIPGAPLFRSDREGFSLTVERGGRVLRPRGADALSALAGFLAAPEAVPALGPAAPEKNA